jgi:cytochrome c biogenesis protein CcmG/thiol:disulfide interchange protein DsbE
MTETVHPQAAAESLAPAAGRKSLRLTTLAVWAGVFILLATLGWGLLRATAERPDDVAPNFEVQFFDGYEWEGRPVASLEDFRGRPVILNFWASWCVECRIEAKLLEDTWQAYRDRGVIFLGVAYVDVEPKSLAYLEEFDITYPNAPDLRSSVSSKYEITGVPETFFIDKQGEIVQVKLGPVDRTTLVGLIDRMLAEPS